MLVLGLALLAVAGCHGGKSGQGAAGHGAADDPRAVEAGRAAIEAGGSAADAAVAMALTMAVTLPSRVGLGGGGLCLVHDPATRAVRTLAFLPESGSVGSAAGGPGFLAGLFALHASYGRRHWEEALGGPESLAGLGTPVSRLLAADLAAGSGRLADDAAAHRLFFGAGGRPLEEGETLQLPELAAALAAVRQHGIAAFQGAAGPMRPAPAWGDTLEVEFDNDIIHFPNLAGAGAGAGAGSGAPLAAAWQAGLAAGEGDWQGALVGALGAGGAGPAVPTASLAVVDPSRQAVACVFTMGGLFGSGRVSPGTGALVAGSGTGSGSGASGLGGPVLMVNHHQWTTLFAGAASSAGPEAGGVGVEAGAAGVTVLSALHGAAVDRRPAVELLAAGGPAAAGRLQAVSCLYDHRSGTLGCGSVADPRGGGVAFTVR